MSVRIQDRLRAAAIHLSLSAVVVGAVFAMVFFVWYPPPTFRIAGALHIVAILIFVDLVLGPMLTLIVFKEDKRLLKMDLTFIATVQLAALLYGAYTMYQEHPRYLVFSVDRFNLVAENAIDSSKIRFDELKQKPFAEVVLVYARLPEDQQVFQEFLFSVLEGEPDLENRPEFWEPYASGVSRILEKARPIESLPRDDADAAARIDKAIATYQQDHPQLGVIPIGTLDEDIGMLVDMQTALPIDVLEVDPWPPKPETSPPAPVSPSTSSSP